MLVNGRQRPKTRRLSKLELELQSTSFHQIVLSLIMLSAVWLPNVAVTAETGYISLLQSYYCRQQVSSI